jgi:DNA-binding beta-propeller fold protein YncE
MEEHVGDMSFDDPRNTVTPIRTATNTPGRPITVGNHPEGIAIVP